MLQDKLTEKKEVCKEKNPEIFKESISSIQLNTVQFMDLKKILEVREKNFMKNLEKTVSGAHSIWNITNFHQSDWKTS